MVLLPAFISPRESCSLITYNSVGKLYPFSPPTYCPFSGAFCLSFIEQNRFSFSWLRPAIPLWLQLGFTCGYSWDSPVVSARIPLK